MKPLAALAAIGAVITLGVAPSNRGARAQTITTVEACSDAAIIAADSSIPASLPIIPEWSAADAPAVATHYAARAKAYSRCGNLTRALANFSIALQLDGSNLMIYANRGDAYERAQQHQEAIRDYSNALLLDDPKQPNRFIRGIYASRAAAYLGAGDQANAIADLDRVIDALKDRPTDGLTETLPNLRMSRAKALFAQGNYSRAEKEFRALSDESPADWDRLAWLGQIRMKLGDAAGAIVALGDAVDRLSPRVDAADQAALYAALGQAYNARGAPADIRSAREAFKHAISLDASNAVALQALAALPPPPAAPVFNDEPVLMAVPMPAGIQNLYVDWPGAFCTSADRNAYLDGTKVLSQSVEANIAAIADYLRKVDGQRAVFDANDQISYQEKISILATFDAEHRRLAAMQADQSRLGVAIRDFFIRVVNEHRLVVGCDKDGKLFKTPNLPPPRIVQPQASAAPPPRAAVVQPPAPPPASSQTVASAPVTAPPVTHPAVPPPPARAAVTAAPTSPPAPQKTPPPQAAQAAAAAPQQPRKTPLPPSAAAPVVAAATPTPRPPPPPRKPTRRELQVAAGDVVNGQRLFDQRQYDRAAEQMAAALQLDPANAEAALGLATAQGYAKLDRQDLAGAEAAFKAAIALRPTGVAWNGLGRALAGRGAAADAIAAFERAAALSPNLAEAQLNRGNVLVSLAAHDPQQYKLANEAFTAAILASAGAVYPEAYLRRGQVTFYAGDYANALHDFMTARAQNRLYIEAIYGAARTLIEQKQYGDAVTAIGDLMQIQQADAAAFCTRGLAFYLRGRDTKATTDFQAAYADFMQAKTLKPTDVDIAHRVSESQGFATPGLKKIMPLMAGRRGNQGALVATATLDPGLACRL